jgi:hypothetical protein
MKLAKFMWENNIIEWFHNLKSLYGYHYMFHSNITCSDDNTNLCTVTKYVQWNFSKPDPQKTVSPWISADLVSPCQTILCKTSLIKLATPLNRPYFLVRVLADLEVSLLLKKFAVWSRGMVLNCNLILKTLLNRITNKILIPLGWFHLKFYDENFILKFLQHSKLILVCK